MVRRRKAAWLNGDVYSILLMIGALTRDPAATQVTLKVLSFDQPEMEVVILDAGGSPAALTLYSHSLSEPVRAQCKEGRLTLFRKPKTDDPKEPLVPLVSLPSPAADGKFIAIVSGGDDAPRLSLVPDEEGDATAGTIRFFNLCAKPVGLIMPGARRVLKSGEEFTVRPQVKAEDYGQAQFLIAKEDGDWQVAGGLRWLQLEDIRSLLFLVPAPGEDDIIKVRGVEERVTTTEKKPPPPSPAGGDEKSRGSRKATK